MLRLVPATLLVATLAAVSLGGSLSAQHLPEPPGDAPSLRSSPGNASLPPLALFARELTSQSRNGFPLPTRFELTRQDLAAPSVDQLKVDLVRQRGLQETLGASRWRRLQNARFKMHLNDLRPFEEMSQEDPYTFDDVLDDYRSNFLKLARSWAEERLGVTELLEGRKSKRRESASGRRRLSISPQLGSGDDPYLGSKLKLRGFSPLLSGFSLSARHRFESGEQHYRLSFQNDLRYFGLEHKESDLTGDREVQVNVRWTF
jgi:hypothetical protein